MKIEKDFVVEAPVELTWAYLRSSENIAHCLPGAQLGTHLGGESYDGSISFQVGPKVVTFFGAARFDYDDDAKRGTLEASGSDRRASSRAKAEIEFMVTGEEPARQSVVSLRGDVVFAGALSQFASEGGVYVGAELLDRFGRCLSEEVEARAGRSGGDGCAPAPAAARDRTEPVVLGGRLQARVALGVLKAAIARIVGIWRSCRTPRSVEVRTDAVE